ncbi:acylphosphatase [Alkalihalobacillus hemicellulosilyticus]|uniref:Acylphosphatase n=1 Tax=Halalkalibacter hemicellulosilyticusJCM 9152 TaxID=1236971 RepID=W4QLI0_9BACI|nr:acylphosphatase [Halalkalibacter hemicellulosilyticus]GAE32965.1 cyanophycin synthetase [Halalkalibacter hemicellulosilyticusJCM 9152]
MVEIINKEWLAHLPMEVVEDARGPEFDAYLIALEGWRRGLTLKWHVKDSEEFKDMKTWFDDKPGKLFSLSSETRTHYFFKTRGDMVSNEAVEIGANKEKTKEYLEKKGIVTPRGKLFSLDTSEENVIEYVKQLDFPLVIKPLDGSFGRGVTTNIQSIDECKDAIKMAKSVPNPNGIIVEEFIQGHEYRLYVVGDKVVGAIQRVPANVKGDGKSTIDQLIDQKNHIRSQNPRLISCLIKKDQEVINHISKQGYNLEDILPDGERLTLIEKSNISLGGDPISVIDDLPEKLKDVAVKAIHSIPNLPHGAVDVMLGNNGEYVVLEINPTAQIGSLLFPKIGKSSDVPAEIIDFYFPETSRKGRLNDVLYFDFSDVLFPLLTYSAKITTVTPIPKGTIYMKKYHVVGEVQRIDYHRGLRKMAFERNLHGMVINNEDGSINIVVAGTVEEMVDSFIHDIEEDPERSVVEQINSSNYDQPIKVGFEIKNDLKKQIELYNYIKKEYDLTELELRKAKKENKILSASKAWKVTLPMRVLGDLIKKYYK